jgi:antitoxin VapB
MANAKVFWSGSSQAVRLPKEVRFKTAEVRIRKHGNAVILEPIATDWSWLDSLEALDDDVIQATREKQAIHERPVL